MARKQFKITYSTLGSPDPLLHEEYDEALTAARAALGQRQRQRPSGKRQWDVRDAHHICRRDAATIRRRRGLQWQWRT